MSKEYWDERAKYYDNLEWVKDKPWLNQLIKFSDIRESDKILDIGAGTGAVSKGLVDLCSLVVAMDISSNMLQQINDKRIHLALCDIEDSYIMTNFFDKIISRMCFHHLDNMEKSLDHCYKMLKSDGVMILTEAVPPSDDVNVVKWWRDMFALKEERRVFTVDTLIAYFKMSFFSDIQFIEIVTKKFNINNWLAHQGLSEDIKDKIILFHINAPDYVKKAHNMEINNKTVFLDSRNLIIKGVKCE